MELEDTKMTAFWPLSIDPWLPTLMELSRHRTRDKYAVVALNLPVHKERRRAAFDGDRLRAALRGAVDEPVDRDRLKVSLESTPSSPWVSTSEPALVTRRSS